VDGFGDLLDDPECQGLLIHGPSGVGKTRLADECLAVAQSRCFSCGRAAATLTAAAVPLGAIAQLLPPEASVIDPVRLFDQVARRSRNGRARAGSSS